MTGREIYKIWAPTSCIWSPWVRPVPFVAIDDHYENHEFINFCPNQITYLEKFDKSKYPTFDNGVFPKMEIKSNLKYNSITGKIIDKEE